ncbi:MAG: acyl carrier protein [Cyclobacteriaceae bacterium]|nr:acyl carrier protein [Cyclobacteriaceae bacterium]
MESKFIMAFKEALEINYEINMEDEFRKYSEWDSLSHMSLIAMLDSEFKMQIENAAFEKLITVADLFKYISARAPK